MKSDLTTGNILKNILLFSLPYLLSYFLQTLYGMADLFIIGQFESVTATTAVSIGSQVMHLITVMLVGLAMGTTVSIGQAVGAKNNNKISTSIGNSVILFFTLSIVVASILLLFVKNIVYLMSTPSEAVKGTINYLRVCFIGIPFITAYNIISSVFRGLGDSKSPMYFIAIACLANIGLDYLFIGYFHMGAVGAALGTTFAQTLSVIIALVVIINKDLGIKMQPADFRPSKDTLRNILKVGLPISFQDGLIQIAFLIITVIANKRGLIDSAAVGIVEKIISFLFLVPSSMLSTVSVLGAQNIGAGKPLRAWKTLRYAIMLASTFGIIVSIVIQFVANPVVGIFTSDSAVIAAGGQYLQGYIFDCIFAGIHFSFSGYFCAIGKSEISFVHNIIAIALVRIPGVYLTSIIFTSSLFPMGLATATGSLVSVIVCLIAVKLLKKNNNAFSI